jgi:4,4'-diaponeurosporenoate glycosyltransferase
VIAFVAVVATGALCGGWLLGRVRLLEEAGAASRRPAVSVIVPARDEEASIPALLASLRSQTASPLEVLVVDDGSSDETARLAADAGATVVHAPPLPHGWAGKPWACHLGSLVARGEVLVFLDADTCLAPDAVGRLLATHARHPLGLLSVQPFHRVERGYEQMSALPNVVSMLASGAFTPRGDGESSLAFGPCLVTSARAYRAAGGHAAVAAEVIEDIHLARRYRAAGLAVHCRAGGPAVRFRMYPSGAGSLVDGWAKNLAGGARLAPLGPALGAVAFVAAGFATIAAAASLLAGGGSVPPVVVALAWAALAGQLGWMLRRIGSFRPWVWILLPVPLVAFAGLLACSWVRRVGCRSVRWSGREIPVRTG